MVPLPSMSFPRAGEEGPDSHTSALLPPQHFLGRLAPRPPGPHLHNCRGCSATPPPPPQLILQNNLKSVNSITTSACLKAPDSYSLLEGNANSSPRPQGAARPDPCPRDLRRLDWGQTRLHPAPAAWVRFQFPKHPRLSPRLGPWPGAGHFRPPMWLPLSHL